MSTKLNMGDSWMIRSADNLPLPEESWINDKKSIFSNKPTFDVNPYPASAYAATGISFVDADGEYEYDDTFPDAYAELVEHIEADVSYIEDDDNYAVYDEEESEDYQDAYADDDE